MLGPLLEIRIFTCPECGRRCKHSFYLRSDPCMIRCRNCDARYVWMHETGQLFALAYPHPPQDSEVFRLIEKFD